MRLLMHLIDWGHGAFFFVRVARQNRDRGVNRARFSLAIDIEWVAVHAPAL
jgi:hypothetical protein